jgi:hypothetical protein
LPDYIDVLSLIAERKILKAIEEGHLDNLSGAGKPLPDDDLATLPPETRLMARLLKTSGFSNSSLNLQSLPTANDLLAQVPEEQKAFRRLSHLKIKLRGGYKPSKNSSPASGSNEAAIFDSPYLECVLDKIFD